MQAHANILFTGASLRYKITVTPVYTLAILALLSLLSSPTELSTMFEEALKVYKQACHLPTSCNTTEVWPPVHLPSEENASDSKYSSRCCGPCSCEDDCFLYGTCCLHLYNSFDDARHYVESTRYVGDYTYLH